MSGTTTPDFHPTEDLRRALEPRGPHGLDGDPPSTAPQAWRITSRDDPDTPTWLLTDPADVRRVLDDPTRFSQVPYTTLGGGRFMLAMDGVPHDAQRRWVINALLALPGLAPREAAPLLAPEALCEAAWTEAALLPLQAPRFDLTGLAEDAAVRWIARWFGFLPEDLKTLRDGCAYVYGGLVHLILGRHIGIDPRFKWRRVESATLRNLILSRLQAYGRLAQGRADATDAALATALADQRAELAAAGVGSAQAWQPLLMRLAGAADLHPPTAQAHVAVDDDVRLEVALGLMGGTVGNVTTAVALLLDSLMAEPDGHEAATREARAWLHRGATPAALDARLMALLKARPPVAYLPRRVEAGAGFQLADGTPVPDGSTLILDLRGADAPFGQPIGGPVAHGPAHDCIGRHVVLPLVRRLVAGLLDTPGLALLPDPVDGRPQRLKRLWGFKALPWAVEQQPGRRRVQQPLRAVMELREPRAQHLADIGQLIAAAAPEIEGVLARARHVHMAWFMPIDGGRQLALFTVYDGDLIAYIDFFTQQVGPLFDALFEHVIDAPRSPIGRNPTDFLRRIAKVQMQHPTVGGGLFSALPQVRVADAEHALRARGVAEPAGVTPPADAVAAAVSGFTFWLLRDQVPDLRQRLREAGLRWLAGTVDRYALRSGLGATRGLDDRPPPIDSTVDALTALGLSRADAERFAPTARALIEAGGCGVPGPRGAFDAHTAALALVALPALFEAADLARVDASTLPAPALRELAIGLLRALREAGPLAPSADGRGLRLLTQPAPGLPRQHALHLLLRVREPWADHAAELLKLWTREAPQWEAALAAHDTGVHFAWALPVAGGREFALCALCDGDPQAALAALIGHVPRLFEATLSHIEGRPAPPGPRDPAALAAHLLRHSEVQAPVANYLFSARPQAGLTELRAAVADWQARSAPPRP